MQNRIRTYAALVLRGWLGSLLVAVLLATSFKSAIAEWYVVPTGSMQPTILEGDRILANKLAYDLKLPYTTVHLATWDKPARGEVVVFNSPADGTVLVKRVIGVPGDVVAMRGNQLVINGVALSHEDMPAPLPDDPCLVDDSARNFFLEDIDGRRHPVMVLPSRPAMRSFAAVTVPEDHYLMLGDSRDNSADSRYIGMVPRRNILGRATTIVASFDILHGYQPRWSRWLTRLL